MPERIEAVDGLQLDQQIYQCLGNLKRLGVDHYVNQPVRECEARQFGGLLQNAAQRWTSGQLREGTDDAVATTAHHAQPAQIVMIAQQFQARLFGDIAVVEVDQRHQRT